MNIRKSTWLPGSIVIAFGLTLGLIAGPVASATTSHAKKMTTFVGGDIHTLTYTNTGLYVTGHLSGSISKDEGITWKTVPSFKNADIMGWATTNGGYLAGGHNGLFRSTNGGKSFTRFNFLGKVSDVHSLGAAGKIVYMGSPQVGFLRSTDSGKTWKVINSKFGQGLMGSMLVDTKDSLKVIAPDMDNGLVLTADGGKTWTRFGGPSGVMSVDWNRKNPKEIVALSMGAGALTKDFGKTWSLFPVPTGASAIALSPSGTKILVAVLGSEKAEILVSNDGGKNWA
ncbi:MAG TPA: hypothetical protein VGJ85_01485 [Candidatus Nanopelagicaceae bacterium]|jgi:hypothetical protein